jgi:hypothetical protein
VVPFLSKYQEIKNFKDPKLSAVDETVVDCDRVIKVGLPEERQPTKTAS